MKIWGPASSRRLRNGPSPGLEATLSVESSPPPVPVSLLKRPSQLVGEELYCVGCEEQQPRRGRTSLKFCSSFCSACPSSNLPTQGEVSQGARLAIAQLRRQGPPIDVMLESPPLKTAYDICALLAAAKEAALEVSAANQGAVPLRTLTLGPWGCTAADHLGCGADCDAASSFANAAEDATTALRALAGCCALWSAWPLKSFTARQLKLDVGRSSPLDAFITALASILASLPLSVQTVRLAGLPLGFKGLHECLATLASAGHSGVSMDLSGTGFCDADAETLAPFMMHLPPREQSCPESGSVIEVGLPSALDEVAAAPLISGLSLSGNARLTSAGLQNLLRVPCGGSASKFSSFSEICRGGLEALDVSECGLGPQGSHILARFLSSPLGAKLRELTAYRTGLGCEGVRLLVEAAGQAPSLRSLNVVANGQHASGWIATVGMAVASALRDVVALRVLTISCPEAELEAAKQLFESPPGAGSAGSVRVILVPNEQNNYNRTLFEGHVH